MLIEDKQTELMMDVMTDVDCFLGQVMEAPLRPSGIEMVVC